MTLDHLLISQLEQARREVARTRAWMISTRKDAPIPDWLIIHTDRAQSDIDYFSMRLPKENELPHE